MSAADPAELQRYVRTCVNVFASLGVLTVVTVAASYLHFTTSVAILVALAIAGVKGSLVACYFMHLISEEKVIYWVLAAAAVFFAPLIILPTLT